MPDFKAAIFDLDGTLFNSLGVWKQIDIDFLAKRNLEVPENYVKEISSLSFIEAAQYTINTFCLEETIEELINQWNSMAIHEYSHKIKLKPYVKEYLIFLKSYGIKLSTATSLHPELSVPLLKNNGIYDLFDTQCNANEVTRGKDFPDIYLLASEKLSIPPVDCLVFEDLLVGLKSAKKLE